MLHNRPAPPTVRSAYSQRWLHNRARYLQNTRPVSKLFNGHTAVQTYPSPTHRIPRPAVIVVTTRRSHLSRSQYRYEKYPIAPKMDVFAKDGADRNHKTMSTLRNISPRPTSQPSIPGRNRCSPTVKGPCFFALWSFGRRTGS